MEDRKEYYRDYYAKHKQQAHDRYRRWYLKKYKRTELMKFSEKCLTLRKADRNKAVSMMRKQGKTYQYIANFFGISRQRVHQVIKDYANVSCLAVIKKMQKEITRCQICNSNEKLVIHHIDRDRRNNGKGNLMRICYGCHVELHMDMNIKGTLSY